MRRVVSLDSSESLGIILAAWRVQDRYVRLELANNGRKDDT